MNTEQKQRAKDLIAAWKSTAYALHADRMAALLQEIIEAPEAEPVAYLHRLEKFTELSFWDQDSASCANRSDWIACAPLFLAPPAPSVPDAKLVQMMVNRFLCWKLPKDFGPDAGISFKPSMPYETPSCWPVGTNLLTADQAKAMIEHMLDGVTIFVQPQQEPPADLVRDAEKWRMLPAFLEEFQIPYLQLDAAIERDKQKGGE